MSDPIVLIKQPYGDKIVKVAYPYDTHNINKSITPNNPYTNNRYCNVLPPPPRSHLNNYPFNTSDCPNNTENNCYYINNNDQNITGLVCNNSGGSYNSNNVRGNIFGNNYNQNMIRSSNSMVHPVQTILQHKNPLIRINSPFYPNRELLNKYNKSYYTYPYKNNYIKYKPFYTYPYRINKDISDNICVKNNQIIEGFSEDQTNTGFIILGIVLSLGVVFYFCKNK